MLCDLKNEEAMTPGEDPDRKQEWGHNECVEILRKEANQCFVGFCECIHRFAGASRLQIARRALDRKQSCQVLTCGKLNRTQANQYGPPVIEAKLDDAGRNDQSPDAD
jgi:hypothetical protein